MENNYKGKHVFLDFINYYNEENITLEECCEYIFNVMNDSLKLTKMRNMHSKMVILKEDTEEGFTSVISLDVFTCGQTDPEIISNYIKENLELKYPNIKCTSSNMYHRFCH